LKIFVPIQWDLSIECRNIDRGIIINCQSFNDAAGPTLSNNSKNVIIEDCYTFGSYDDSFACLGNIPTTTAITFKKTVLQMKDSTHRLQ
jgi:hypothetical protein